MKVWELIAILSKSPAGSEVYVSVAGSLYTQVDDVELFDDEDFIGIQGGEAELCSDGGGWVSEATAPSE